MKHTINITAEREYDLVVCGGGPAGIGAALSAAKNGLSVLLVESQGQLGGMGTSGLVSHWLGGRTYDSKNWVVGGVFRELASRAGEAGTALLPDVPPEGELSPFGWTGPGALNAGIPFDPYAMAALLDDVFDEAGIDVLFFTTAVDVILTDSHIQSVILSNKSGFTNVKTKAVVDATGDADIAARSGCETILGRSEDHLMTPVTLQVHMDHIDFQAFKDSQNSDKSQQGRYLKDIQRWIENGEWPFSYNRLISVQMPREDTFMVNTSRMTGFDGTDAASVSKAMAQGRRESLMLLEILRRKIPGFRDARIKAIAPLLGVRETRRILGDFLLTLKHFQEETAFDDIIGYAAYGWDLPDPHKPSVNPDVGKAAGIKRSVMPIPYRVMLPKKIRNLICPGRAVSVERPILGPFRVQAPCMAMGEAAGVAAALMIREQSTFDTIDAAQLRTTLKQQNAIVNANAFTDNPVKM